MVKSGVIRGRLNEGLEHYLREVDGLKIKYAHFEPSFLPTAMDGLFRSLQALESKRWNKRVVFVNEMVSNNDCKINNALFSSQLQNTWHDTLTEVALYLGISQPFSKNSADRFYLDEVVEKRNQIAHGRNSPLNVGSSGRSSDLELRFDAIARTIEDFLEMLEQHFNTLDFVKASYKAQYQKP